MFIIKPFSGAILLLLLISCHNAKDSSISASITSTIPAINKPSSDQSVSMENKIPVEENGIQFTDTSTTQPSQHPQSATLSKGAMPVLNTDWTKKIIKNAVVKIEVKDFKSYSDFLHEKLKQYGSYIAQEENSIADERSQTIVSIKVPAQFFDPLLNELPGTAGKLVERNIKTEDVTGDIADTRSRLEAKKQMRLKYLDFLKESKNMTEVLQVQSEIDNIQEEIEAASGRFAALTTQSAYSTINLTYFKVLDGFKAPDDKPSFFGKAGAAFSVGAGWLSGLFIGLIAIWPLVLAVGAGIFIYKKRSLAKRLPQNV